jgi:hypothetical protein
MRSNSPLKNIEVPYSSLEPVKEETEHSSSQSEDASETIKHTKPKVQSDVKFKFLNLFIIKHETETDFFQVVNIGLVIPNQLDISFFWFITRK